MSPRSPTVEGHPIRVATHQHRGEGHVESSLDRESIDEFIAKAGGLGAVVRSDHEGNFAGGLLRPGPGSDGVGAAASSLQVRDGQEVGVDTRLLDGAEGGLG